MNPYLFFRTALGLTQTQIADLYVPPFTKDEPANREQYYRRFEHGLVHPSYDSASIIRFGEILDEALSKKLANGSFFVASQGKDLGWAYVEPMFKAEIYREEDLNNLYFEMFNYWVETTEYPHPLEVDDGVRNWTWPDRYADWIKVQRYLNALAHGRIGTPDYLRALSKDDRRKLKNMRFKSAYAMARTLLIPVADVQAWQKNGTLSNAMRGALEVFNA